MNLVIRDMEVMCGGGDLEGGRGGGCGGGVGTAVLPWECQESRVRCGGGASSVVPVVWCQCRPAHTTPNTTTLGQHTSHSRICPPSEFGFVPFSSYPDFRLGRRARARLKHEYLSDFFFPRFQLFPVPFS